MEEHSGPVFLFGGHIFSQYLLKSGIDEGAIECVIDNDPEKHGMRLYGTELKVYGSSKLSEYKNAAIILHAGWYHEEIKQGIYDSIGDDVIFWE